MKIVRRWLFIYAIYLDVLILENTALDLACLLMLGAYRGYRIAWGRLLVTAALGGAAGALALCFLQDFLLYLLCGTAISLLQLWAAYGRRRMGQFVGDAALCLLFCILLGGALGFLRQFLPIKARGFFLPLAIVFGVAIVLLWKLCRRRRSSYAKASCLIGGTIRHFRAFCDTGNCLRDARTGLPVCIVSEEWLEAWGISRETLRRLPYETLAGEGSVWVCQPSLFCIEKDGKIIPQADALLGFADPALFRGKSYQMILHRQYCG